MLDGGYGREQPIVDDSTEEGRTRNRRINVKVARRCFKTLLGPGIMQNELAFKSILQRK